MRYDPVIATHRQDPACPGHDVNRVLATASAGAGYCLCIHPDRRPASPCQWCSQPVTATSYAPQTMDLRTGILAIALGAPAGPCGFPGDTSAGPRPELELRLGGCNPGLYSDGKRIQ